MNRFRLDARIALVSIFFYSIGLFLVDSWIGMAIACVMAIFFVLAVNPDIKKVSVSLVPLYFILIFTIMAHIPTGVFAGMFYALRILLLAIVTLTVVFGFDDTYLVRAMTFLLSPLRFLHVPVDDIATMFSIALRFIPVSMEEMKKVYIAQKSRAVVFEKGSLFGRVSKWGNVFIPVIVGLFRRAERLAEAMEARCYSGRKRTSLHNDAIGASNWVFLAAALLSIGALIAFF